MSFTQNKAKKIERLSNGDTSPISNQNTHINTN